jgi:glycosyltransferase involved in cell wall biosynthesis
MMTARKKKILQLTQDYGSSIDAVCNEYSRCLDRDEFHITVAFLTGQADPTVEKDIVADRVIFLELPKSKLRGLRFRATNRIVELFKSNSYDVVVCHRYKAAQIMSLARLFCDIPSLYYVIHGYGYMNSFRRKLYAFLFMKEHFRFVAVSEAVRKDILRSQFLLTPAAVLTVHNTLPTEVVMSEQLGRQTARRELGLNSTDFVFGTVGRMVPWKNHEILMKAFALARSEMTDAKLVIVGGGRLNERLKQLALDLSLNESMIFTGVIPKAHRLMKAFDAFVLPSENEPFGIVLLEAMAAQVPIISSASGAPPEIVGSFGIMVSAKEPQAYAKKMIEVFSLSEDERQELGLLGFGHLQHHFAKSRFSEIL